MISIKELTSTDEEKFISAVEQGVSLHHPWINPPKTSDAFKTYITRSTQENQKSFLVMSGDDIAGVINLNEIIRGSFQNAFLGFYVFSGYESKGIMSTGLKLTLKEAFESMKLHRLEANIQPKNNRSIQLIKNSNFRYEGFSPRYLKINEQWCGHERWALTAEEYIQDRPEVIRQDSIEIVSYDSDWPAQASVEIDIIQSIFPKDLIVSIEHVGSTAILDMPAKPIIDIQIAVDSLEIAKIIAVPLLQKLDYEYWVTNPDPQRLFFVRGMPPYGDKRTHHVHIVEKTSHHWKDKLTFRDILRKNSKLADAYKHLKLKLSEDHQYDRERYTKEKTDFIKSVLKKA